MPGHGHTETGQLEYMLLVRFLVHESIWITKVQVITQLYKFQERAFKIHVVLVSIMLRVGYSICMSNHVKLKEHFSSSPA